MKLLIIAPAWIGDAVLAQPLFKRLHHHQPGLQLDLLATPWVAPVFSRMAEVEQIIEAPLRHGYWDWQLRWSLAQSLRTNNYDQAIVLPHSWKSALIPWMAGIPQRTGRWGECRIGLLNDLIRKSRRCPPSGQAQDYARLAGPCPPGEALPALALTSTAQTQQAACAHLGLTATPAPIILCPGAEYGPAKRWPAGHFARLASIVLETKRPVWLLGGTSDQACAEEILAHCGHPEGLHNLCGATGLDQAIDLLALARHVVTNDSGLMHIAAALHRPLIALFGSSSPTRTPPLSPQAQVIRRDLPCSPCFARQCRLGHLNCLTHIQPEEVAAAMGDLSA
jgi:heptosyltransferase-2